MKKVVPFIFLNFKERVYRSGLDGRIDMHHARWRLHAIQNSMGKEETV